MKSSGHKTLFFIKKTKDKTNEKVRNDKERKTKMHLIKNMKIMPKILSGFLIISLLSAGLGVYASLGIQSLSTSSKEMYSKILLPSKILSKVTDTFHNESKTVRQALICNKESFMDSYVSNVKNYGDSISTDLSMLESLISNDKAGDFDKLESSINTFQPIINGAMNNIQSGNKDAVINDLMINGNLAAAEVEVDTNLSDLASAINSDAAMRNTKNSDSASEVFDITLFSFVGVFLLSILMGVIMAAGISKPLKKLTKNAKLLAAGEIDVDISAEHTKDEVGQTFEAFRTILNSISELVNDTDMLISAATNGELSVRADAEKHMGVYRKIVEGINATLDASIDPMIESANVLGELSKGNLDVSVTGDFKGDFALVKNALNDTIKTLKEYIGEITSALEKISNGILDAGIETEYRGDFIVLKDSINMSLDSFNGVLKDIDLAAQEVANGTMQLSSGSQTISGGATEQANAIEKLTDSISGIAEHTGVNVQRANDANQMSQQAKKNAQIGNEKMKELQTAMQEINDSSSNISKIIKVIDDIAFQTNILALNAAVEAARAGIHGKGFAVVAEEVRNLAARSAKAAKETTSLIETSISKTKTGTKLTEETAGALTEIVDRIEKAVDLSQEIVNTSNEQATEIAEINKGIEQLSLVVQTNSATAQQAAASSEELTAQANQLKEMVRRFKLRA